MANITLTIPDDQVDRILTALNYDPTSGLTKVQFIKQYLRGKVLGDVINYEVNTAKDTASQTAATKVQSDILIT